MLNNSGDVINVNKFIGKVDNLIKLKKSMLKLNHKLLNSNDIYINILISFIL